MMACLVGMDDCFNCRKSGHKMKDSLLLATQKGDGRQAQPSGSGSDAPKQNKLYDLHTRQNHEGFPNVATDILKVFHLVVYVLLDLDAMLSYITSYVVLWFDVGLEILLIPFISLLLLVFYYG